MEAKERANRRSIRLQGFDYSQNGLYFVTICMHERQRLLSEIVESDVSDVKNNGYELTDLKTNGMTKRHHRAGSPNLFVGAHPCVRPFQPGIMLEKWLNKIETRYDGVWVDSYVIMPDHIHFVLVIGRDVSVTGAHTGAPLQALR